MKGNQISFQTMQQQFCDWILCWHADHAAVMQSRSKQLVSFPKHLKIWITNFS